MLKWFEEVETDEEAFDSDDKLSDGPSEHNENQTDTEQSGDNTDVVSNLQFNPGTGIPKRFCSY